MNKIKAALDSFEQLIGMFEPQECKEERKILKIAREEFNKLNSQANKDECYDCEHKVRL